MRCILLRSPIPGMQQSRKNFAAPPGQVLERAEAGAENGPGSFWYNVGLQSVR
jgi:hypothetical protein